MELFSEIYSAYYNAVSKILSQKNLSEKDMEKIIRENAFSDSAFYLLPKLKNDWYLLSEKDKIYNSRLKEIPSVPLTSIEKRWLKSILSDPKASLFLDGDTISRLMDFLKDVKPLFKKEYFLFFDRFSDGDDFKNSNYIKNFKIIHKAVIMKNILKISFISSKNKKISNEFLPLKFEYSPKNNRFRIYAAGISGNKINGIVIINISRITGIKNTGMKYTGNIDIKKILKSRRCSEPVCVEVSSERNGVERFMMEFAGYEKITEFHEESGKCTAYIWYNVFDETELLIRLLSFGPVLEIKSPEYFRNLARERINKQVKINFQKFSD